MIDDKPRCPGAYQNDPPYLAYHDWYCPRCQHLIEHYPAIEKGLRQF